MEIFSIPVILRAVEILFDIIIISVYYGTNTYFDSTNSTNNFGEFVIIGSLICACIMLAISLFLDLNKKMPYVVIGYNVVWIIFYLTASIIIFSNFTKSSFIYIKKKRNGGLTVGSFLLFDVAVLIISSLFIFKSKEN